MSASAYFLSWTVRGSWLHGDKRGSIDRDHNQHNTPFVEGNNARSDFERSEVSRPPIRLDDRMRPVIEQAIRDHCAHRSWTLHEVHVRTNHVHVVLSAPCEPENPLREFKAWATRRLREAGLVDENDRIWTRHGSTRYLFTDESLARAIRYVRDGQGERLD